MLKKFLKNLKFLKNYGKIILNALIIGVLVIVLVVFVIKNKEESESFVIENSRDNMINMNEDNGTNERKKEKELEEVKQKEEDKTELIKVHVDGFVNNPGLIELKEGSRINDAIEKAGGITEEGDLSKVNLAYILSDGEKIYIPSIYDEKEENVDKVEESKKGKVNINNASEEELKSITGIGASTAKKIIEYRVDNGKFNSIEDIKNVSRDRR